MGSTVCVTHLEKNSPAALSWNWYTNQLAEPTSVSPRMVRSNVLPPRRSRHTTKYRWRARTRNAPSFPKLAYWFFLASRFFASCGCLPSLATLKSRCLEFFCAPRAIRERFVAATCSSSSDLATSGDNTVEMNTVEAPVKADADSEDEEAPAEADADAEEPLDAPAEADAEAPLDAPVDAADDAVTSSIKCTRATLLLKTLDPVS